MKILVVDPDVLFVRLLRAKLERWGHSVVVETDGERALQRIRHEPYRMVILDWDLPGMNGIELCRRIRELKRPRYTYVIFYTARIEKERVIEGLEAGADDYLNKPLNSLELRLRIKSGKRLLNLEDVLRETGGADSVTGVVNAASFRQFFRVALAEARRTGSQGALLFVDLDNYGDILDEQGIGPAEALMKELARLFERMIRESDLVARLGRSRFCLLLQNTNWDRCHPVVEKVQAHLPQVSVLLDDSVLRPSCSLSIINYPQGDMGYEALLDSAPRQPVGAPGASQALSAQS